MLAAHLAAISLSAGQPAVPPPGVETFTPVVSSEVALAPSAGDDALLDDAPPPTEQPAPAVAGPTLPVASAPGAEDDFLENELKPAGDPLEGVNRISFDLSWFLDKVVIRPAAMVYRAIVPKPARDGIHNAMNNLNEPIVFANDLLQLRPGRALRTLARFVINSTIGLGGLFDIAKREPFNLQPRTNSFGSTLGYYGVKPGPYLYIPILGPTTLRDMADNAQGYVWPGPVGDPFDRKGVGTATMVLGGLDQRERNDAELKAMFRDSIDRYASFRSNYLQNRQGDIEELKARNGEAPRASGLDDPLTDPEAPPSEPER